MGEGPRDDCACASRHDTSVAASGERAVGRAGEERICSSSKCRASRAKLQRKDLFPGMVGEVPGSASCICETQRLERPPECSGSGARCQGSWWSSKTSRGRREPHTHTQSFRARTRWQRRASFGCAGDAGSTPHNG